MFIQYYIANLFARKLRSKVAKIFVHYREGFNLESIGFIKKNLVCVPVTRIKYFSNSQTALLIYHHAFEKKIYHRVFLLMQNLQGCDRDDSNTPNNNLITVCLSYSERVYAKGNEKCDICKKTVDNLEDLNGLRVSELFPEKTVAYCILFSNIFTTNCQVLNHCA